MEYIGKFIRYHTRTEKKSNPKSGGKICILCMGGQPNLLVALVSITVEQGKRTTKTEAKVHKF